MNKCPICNENEVFHDGRDALSRKDNETYICTPCSIKEALFSAGRLESEQN